jgi:serine/threonine protein kinase
MQESFNSQSPYMPYWLAPEVLRGEPISEDSDVYSFGILLLFLLNGLKNPFERYSLAQFQCTVSYFNRPIVEPPEKVPAYFI